MYNYLSLIRMFAVLLLLKVVTCGNVPLESSFQRVPRCVYTSTRLYEYRAWGSKPANPSHRHFTWGLRSSEVRRWLCILNCPWCIFFCANFFVYLFWTFGVEEYFPWTNSQKHYLPASLLTVLFQISGHVPFWNCYSFLTDQPPFWCRNQQQIVIQNIDGSQKPKNS
jgi:hypothetical protein